MTTKFRPTNHYEKDDPMRRDNSDSRSPRGKVIVLGGLAVALVTGLVVFGMSDGPLAVIKNDLSLMTVLSKSSPPNKTDSK